MEIALERSVRNTFNGGSRHIRRVHESPGELKANGGMGQRCSSAVSNESSVAAAVGAGPGNAAIDERTANADAGLLHAGAFSDACVVDGDSGLAAQCGTSLQEQERALEQCKARHCGVPRSAPGMQGEGIPYVDAGPHRARISLERVVEDGDSGLAALYGTNLREQEKALALCRGRCSGALDAVSGSTKKTGKGRKR